MLTIDCNESKDIISGLKRSEGLEGQVEVVDLQSGDYVFGDVGIERKTVNDLISSAMNKRLWNQLHLLKETYKDPLLLIEGMISWTDAVMTGILTSLILFNKIRIVYTDSKDDTVKAVKALYLKYGKGKSNTSLPPVVIKADTPSELREAMLQSIRGIGPVIAKKIIEALPCLFLTEYTPEEIRERLKGIYRCPIETIINVFKQVDMDNPSLKEKERERRA